jgi:predicted ribosomally synthesized peptide with SipW-like signal peptide
VCKYVYCAHNTIKGDLKAMRKGLKGALISAIFTIIACVSLFAGTTFAWFTDSVTSGGNVIKAGNLKVGMTWAKGIEDPYADTTVWTNAASGAIFNYDNWEPLYTEVCHIKIENKGTLALKYQLNISADGAVSELVNVIDVYYFDPAQQVDNRNVLTEDKKIGTLAQVLASLESTATGKLLQGESITITIALRMQPDAGNEYADLSIGSSFSVVLTATQLAYEKDSIDENYDKDATTPIPVT